MSMILTDFQEALEEFHQNYADFLAATRKIRPEDRDRNGVCGIWSPKQVVAHLSGWLREERENIQKLMENPRYHKEYDEDEFNAQSVADRAGMDWDQTLNDFIDAYRDFEKEIANITIANLSDWKPVQRTLKILAGDFVLHRNQFEEWLDVDL